MPEPTPNDIVSSLSAITNPVTGEAIVAAGHVEGVVIKQGNVGFSIRIDPQHAEACEAMRQECEQRVAALPGVLSVTAVLTAHESAPDMAGRKKAPEKKTPEVFGRIKTVIAVVSGKGGVGKSTVALNLAAALAAKGETVGFLDADIFGPSAPQMLGISDNPDVTEDKKLIPVDRYGLLAMSIGFLVPADQPLAWRGPMVQGALLQMLNDVAWPELDCLVIDLPPGTGDIQLTLAQQIPVTGAVVVTTPQALAVADVRRSIAMLQKTATPVIGVVENMAWMFAPDGETRLHPFGEGGGELITTEMNVPYLGQLPLDPTLQEATNAGQPVTVFAPDGPATEAFGTLAEMILTGTDH
ncbi:MAG: P-loop NTPase [Parvibaculales bacterium]